jgi:hypothetical protein
MVVFAPVTLFATVVDAPLVEDGFI